MVQDYQSYIDPTEEVDTSQSKDEDAQNTRFGEETLTCNLGIRIAVVCTKVYNDNNAFFYIFI